ncbi:hemolysin family protein [Rossellomorea aquimaris]|uniref:hemolysin family protein n=1 Tax=Rossellomorea aquimaris TaxID=189382 RepID=UPI0007D0B69F|nr:hemolysin family protein [Rossellomorea aquimaris]
MDIFSLVLVAVLIGLTAFFVASEFAIVKVRKSRIEQLVEEGNGNALAAKKVITSLDEYLSACQLGITVTALGLGWVGEPAIAKVIQNLLGNVQISDSVTHGISVGVAFTVITFLHVVIGELAPKTLAIQKAETITLLFSRPLILFYRVMYPFIWTLNGSAQIVSRLLGGRSASEHEGAHSEEELRMIVSESYKSGEINQSEFKYVNKIFEFNERMAKEIMVPRTEIVSLSADDQMNTLLDTVQEEKFTRYPIIDGDKDHIIGFINVKEVFTDLLHKETSTKSLSAYVRPVIQVIETIPIHILLLKMQRERTYIAILLDEYGGTSGLVTIEDIVEEIVGEIRDEFDIDETPQIHKLKEDHFILDGKVLVSELNTLLGIEMNEEEVDTLGGWILTQNYEAKQGDLITFADYSFYIKRMEDHHIKTIEVTKKQPMKAEVIEKLPIIQTDKALSQ